MKIKYFQDTDTLYIEFRAGRVVDELCPEADIIAG